MSEDKGKGGVKHDQDKAMLALIPPLAEEQMALAFTEGYHKYGMYNWREGSSLGVVRLLSAARRHINKTLRGEDLDPEMKRVKVHHLGAALACLAMAYETIVLKPELDDRYIINAKSRDSSSS